MYKGMCIFLGHVTGHWGVSYLLGISRVMVGY